MPNQNFIAKLKDAVSWGKTTKIPLDHEAEMEPTPGNEEKETIYPAMSLCNMPEELFRGIMEILVVSSVKSAMRSRLVCKSFDEAIWRALVDTRVLQGKSPVKSTSYPRNLRAKYLERRTLRSPKGHYPSELALEMVDKILDLTSEDHTEKKNDYLATICKVMVTRHPGSDYSPSPDTIAGLSGKTAHPPYYNKPSLEENTLVAAAWLKLNPIVTELLADPKVRLVSSILGSALEAAVYHNDVKLARTLLERERPGSSVLKPVMYHIGWRDRRSILELLFDPQYDIRLSNSQLEEGIRQAAYHDSNRIIEYILEHAPMHDICGYSGFNQMITQTEKNHPLRIEDYILYRACVGGSMQTARRAIANGAHRGAYRSFPTLTYAATKGYTDIVELLLDDIEMCDSLKAQLNPALSAAVRGDWFRVAHILLKYGADSNHVPEKSEDNLLAIAIKNGFTSIVTILLQHGATVEESQRQELYDHADLNGHSETATLLNEVGLIDEKAVAGMPNEKVEVHSLP